MPHAHNITFLTQPVFIKYILTSYVRPHTIALTVVLLVLISPVCAADDLIVESGNTQVIENQVLVIDGDIVVESGATLIIRNSDVTVNSHYKNQYWVYVYSEATLLIENSILREGPVPNLACVGQFGAIENFRYGETVIQPEGDNAKIIMRNSTSEPRLGPGEGSSVLLESSYLSILFWRALPSASTTVTDSDIQMIHLWLHGENEENVELAGLHSGEDSNLELSVEGADLTIENSWVGRYSVALWIAYPNTDCRKHVTIKDSELSEIFAVFPKGSDVKLWGMTPGFFENWDIHENMEESGVPWGLRLENVYLEKWKLDFHGTAEIENSRFHLDTWDRAEVTVESSTIVSNHHTRGGHIKFRNSIISDREEYPAGVRFLYQPLTENYDPIYMYEFENSTLGPYAEFEFTDDNIACEFRGELEVLVPPELIHWFGGTVGREFPIAIVDENGKPVAGAKLELRTQDNQLVWEGETDEDGSASLTLVFGKDNYEREFELKCWFENEELQTTLSFFSSTPIILAPEGILEKEGIKLWEITAALRPTVFVLTLSAFWLALRAQRRRKRPLDIFGPHPAWVVAATYWYGPIYDTVVGPLAGLGVMSPGPLAPLAYAFFAPLMAAFFYAAAYLWRTGRPVLAVASVAGLNLYASTVFDYQADTTLDFMVRHLAHGSVCFPLLFLGVMWATKNWRRRMVLILSLVGILVVGNCISGAAFGRGV